MTLVDDISVIAKPDIYIDVLLRLLALRFTCIDLSTFILILYFHFNY